MIQNDKELEAIQQRIAYFQQLLAQFRVTARVEEFPILSSSYISEIETMQNEVMQYLSSHVSSNAA